MLFPAFVFVLKAEGPASDPSAPPQLLVLRNGQILEGQVSRTNAEYLIEMPNGHMTIGAAEVELVCSSLEEGFQRKKAAIQPGNFHDRLQLAQWSLRHELWQHAGDELAEAAAIQPDHPMVAILQARLKMALEPPAAKPEDADKPASHPTNDELNRMVRNLPPGTVESFAQSVQPVLMHRCATAGCHGPQADNPLRLSRVSGNVAAGRRTTQRNLYTVLSYVDRANPVGSALLIVPNGPHGQLQRAVFSQHEVEQYKRLVDWAVHLSQPTAPDSNIVEAASPIDSIDAKRPDAPPRVLSQNSRNAQPLPAKSPSPAADPFDPDVFNRRFDTKKPASPQEESKPEATIDAEKQKP